MPLVQKAWRQTMPRMRIFESEEHFFFKISNKLSIPIKDQFNKTFSVIRVTS
jgi:hypothetical protein